MPVEYWRIETGGSGGGPLKRPLPTPPTACGTHERLGLLLEVENFDVTAKTITDLGRHRCAAEIRGAGHLLARAIFVDPEGKYLRASSKLTATPVRSVQRDMLQSAKWGLRANFAVPATIRACTGLYPFCPAHEIAIEELLRLLL